MVMASLWKNASSAIDILTGGGPAAASFPAWYASAAALHHARRRLFTGHLC